MQVLLNQEFRSQIENIWLDPDPSYSSCLIIHTNTASTIIRYILQEPWPSLCAYLEPSRHTDEGQCVLCAHGMTSP